MSSYFFDSSALLKRWLQEPGAKRVRALTARGAARRLYAARLAIPEILGALARRHRAADIADIDRARLFAAVRADVRALLRMVEIPRATWDHAGDLAERRCLRGADAVHVAAALAVQVVHAAGSEDEVIFVTADREQGAAALAEGLAVEDPSDAE